MLLLYEKLPVKQKNGRENKKQKIENIREQVKNIGTGNPGGKEPLLQL